VSAHALAKRVPRRCCVRHPLNGLCLTPGEKWRLARRPLKKLEFREAEPEPGPPAPEIEPGLEAFLQDAKLSADLTEEETVFLKNLTWNGRRPSPLYFYRELQNLRDPLHFLPLSSKKRPEPARNKAAGPSPVRRKTAPTRRLA
jgi:hypothetical protein